MRLLAQRSPRSIIAKHMSKVHLRPHKRANRLLSLVVACATLLNLFGLSPSPASVASYNVGPSVMSTPGSQLQGGTNPGAPPRQSGLGNVRLSFEPNAGQADPSVR